MGCVKIQVGLCQIAKLMPSQVLLTCIALLTASCLNTQDSQSEPIAAGEFNSEIQTSETATTSENQIITLSDQDEDDLPKTGPWQWREFANPAAPREPITMFGERETPSKKLDVDGDGSEELLINFDNVSYLFSPESGYRLSSTELPKPDYMVPSDRDINPDFVTEEYSPGKYLITDASLKRIGEDEPGFSIMGYLTMPDGSVFEVYRRSYEDHLQVLQAELNAADPETQADFISERTEFLQQLELTHDGLWMWCGNTTMNDFVSNQARMESLAPEVKQAMLTEFLLYNRSTGQACEMYWPEEYMQECCPIFYGKQLMPVNLPNRNSPDILFRPNFCRHLLVMSALGKPVHMETFESVPYRTAVLRGPEHDSIAVVFKSKTLVYP